MAPPPCPAATPSRRLMVQIQVGITLLQEHWKEGESQPECERCQQSGGAGSVITLRLHCAISFS